MTSTMPDLPAFGGPAADYTPEAFDPDDIWIKGFQVGTTQVRILPAESIDARGNPVHGAAAWPTEREHYDETVYAFPCSEKYGIPCPGCESDNSKVRERNRRYYFNALDREGEQRIFKIGQGLYDVFLSRQQRYYDDDPGNLQPLSDRDFLITRIGTTKQNTKYDPDTGDTYPVEFPEPYDIRGILSKAFQRAWAHFHAQPVVAPQAPEGFGSNGTTRIGAKTASAPAAGASSAPAPQDTPAPPKLAAPSAPAAADDDEDVLGRFPTPDEFEDATSGALKAYLRRPEVNVEFPARAARSRLLDLAKATLDPKF